MLCIRFDYSLLPMKEYSNIRSTGSDYQNVAVFCEAITENGRRKLDEEQNGRIWPERKHVSAVST